MPVVPANDGRICVRSTTAQISNVSGRELPGRTPQPLSHEFIARLGVVVEEADETNYWLTLAVACELVTSDRADGLIRDSKELLAIFVASRTTARETRT